MTIQAVDITHLGIVMAADGAVSFGEAETLPRKPEHWRRRKLFRVDNLRGAIGYFGLAQIGGRPLHEWLERFIHTHRHTSEAGEFAHLLAEALTKVISLREAKHKLGFHLCCHRATAVGPVPELHFIRNRETDDPGSGRRFVSSERVLGYHFKQLKDTELLEGLANKGPIFFQNGYIPVYNAFSSRLVDGLSEGVWGNPEFLTRPQTIREWGKVTEFRLRVVRTVFDAFYKRPGLQPVGGRLRLVAIPTDVRLPLEEWTA